MPHAVNAVRMTLADGREVGFLLTMGGLKRLKERFGAKTLAEFLQRDETDIVPILWEALLDKEGLTEATFGDLVPAHVRTLFEVFARLLGASLPEASAPENPPPASPPVVQ